jgi:hypothetical protein
MMSQNENSNQEGWRNLVLGSVLVLIVAAYFVKLPPDWGGVFREWSQSQLGLKSFGMDVWFKNIGVLLWNLFFTLCVTMAYISLGRHLAIRLGVGETPLPISFALGAVGFAMVLFGLGLCGLWFRPIVGLVLALGILGRSGCSQGLEGALR